MNPKNEVAVFGGGCFWCTEAIFQRLKGVISVTPGYAAGNKNNPTYEDVQSGLTGHAEVIKVVFNPQIISYRNLFKVFWNTHDPTTTDRQGPDVGTQYRSIILYTSRKQKLEANAYKQKLEKRGKFKKPIVTQIEPLQKFFLAERYHWDYYNKNRKATYCRIVIAPKLKKLQKNQFLSLNRNL